MLKNLNRIQNLYFSKKFQTLLQKNSISSRLSSQQASEVTNPNVNHDEQEKEDGSIESMADYLNSNIDYSKKRPTYINRSTNKLNKTEDSPSQFVPSTSLPKTKQSPSQQDLINMGSKPFAQDIVKKEDAYNHLIYKKLKFETKLKINVKKNYQDNEELIISSINQQSNETKNFEEKEAPRLLETNQSNIDAASFFGDDKKSFRKKTNKFKKENIQLETDVIPSKDPLEKFQSPTLDLTLKENESVNELEVVEDLSDLTEEEIIKRDIQKLRPAYRPLVYNLAYFANDNEILRAFIKMGVSIRKWDEDKTIGELILRLDMEKNVKPILIFLNDIGIENESLSFVITKNPKLFAQDLTNLNARIEYLKSKKFDNPSITQIITKAPLFLNLNVTDVDTKLGWYQNEFGLTGNEIRQIVTERPKLITLPLQIPSKVKFYLKEFVDYDNTVIKRFLITYPKLFTKEFKKIEANFVYLTQVVKLTHEEIAVYPPALHAPLHLLKARYAYLKYLDRIQFDPTKPNFISLKMLCEPFDETFCKKSAKTSLNDYIKFLKTV